MTPVFNTVMSLDGFHILSETFRQFLTLLVLKFEQPFYYLLMCRKTAGSWAENSLDTDQKQKNAASD